MRVVPARMHPIRKSPDDGNGCFSSTGVPAGPLHLRAAAPSRRTTATPRRSDEVRRRRSPSLSLGVAAVAASALVLAGDWGGGALAYSPPTMRLRARDLLETARSLREQRGVGPIAQDADDADRRRRLAEIGLRPTADLFGGPASAVASLALAGGQRGSAATSARSWTEALFDEAETQDLLVVATGDGDENDDDDNSDIVARVQAEVPAVASLRTATGSEIPDMELHLQMEAARRRARGGRADDDFTRRAAFIESHDPDATSIEKMAMNAVPVQLPGPAAGVGPVNKGRVVAAKTRSVVGASDKKGKVVAAGSVKTRASASASTSVPTSSVGGTARRTEANKDAPTSPPSSASSKRKKLTKITASSERQQQQQQIKPRSKAESKAFTRSVSSLLSAKHQSKSSTMAHATARVTHEEELELARIVQRGAELNKIRTDFESTHGREITRQEWTDLAGLESPRELRRLVSNYRSAKNKLVTANMGLVYAVVKSLHAGRSQSSGITQEELVQEGSLGLLRAAELFDPRRGLRFSTYATIWIKGVLSNSKVDETIALPSREKAKWNKIRRAAADLAREDGASDAGGDNEGTYRPKVKDVASRTGMDAAEVRRVTDKMERARKLLSLDYEYDSTTRSGTVEGTRQSLENDRAMQCDYDLVERLQVRADVIAALARNLDPREARLMRLRYGLKDGISRSLAECADAMGISREKARLLALECLKKLREADDADSLQEYLLTVA